MRAVSDTSPLSYLILIGQLDLLPKVFTAVSIPDEVRAELASSRAPSAVQKWIAHPPPWLVIGSAPQSAGGVLETSTPAGSENSDQIHSGNSGHPGVSRRGPDSPWKAARGRMLDMLKRHAIQVLRRAGHSLPDVAKLAGVSVRSVQRVEVEGRYQRRQRSRAYQAEDRPAFEGRALPKLVVELLTKEPEVLSLEVLRRARLDGYDGGKSALYELIHSIRPKSVRLMTRFEGLPRGVHAARLRRGGRALPGRDEESGCTSSPLRLKYSRWTEVSIVPNEQVETLVFEAILFVFLLQHPLS